MKLLFDFFPILLFFVTFKMYGIFTATGVAIIASVFQVIIYWWKKHRIELMHVLTLFLIIVLGAATLIFHDMTFIKWKPTAVYWAFGLAFLISRFVGNKPLIQTMMEDNVQLPPAIWQRLNLSWFVFFAIMGVLKIYVMYHFDTNTWVNFKLFGGIGLTILFVIAQALYLSRHVELNEKQQSVSSS